MQLQSFARITFCSNLSQEAAFVHTSLLINIKKTALCCVKILIKYKTTQEASVFLVNVYMAANAMKERYLIG